MEPGSSFRSYWSGVMGFPSPSWMLGTWIVEFETSAAPRADEYMSSGSGMDQMFNFVSEDGPDPSTLLWRWTSLGRGRVVDSAEGGLSELVSKSVSDIPHTGKLPGLGRFWKRGFVLAMNLNSLESTSVRWKGVLLGSLDWSRSDGKNFREVGNELCESLTLVTFFFKKVA